MTEILEKILADCDEDIRQFVMTDSNQMNGEKPYKNWELMYQPNMCIILWQMLRKMSQ